MSSTNPEGPQEPPSPHSAALESAIRALIREEVGPPKPRPSQKASGADAAWLFVCLLNLALLLWWAPAFLFDSKKVDAFLRFVPLLGGYFFALGYLWSRERILAVGRHPAFKIVQAVLLVLLIPASASQTRIFRLTPLVEPAEVVVLRVNEEKEDPKALYLPLRTHTVTVSYKGEGESKWQSRKFTIGPWDILAAWWGGQSPKLYWPLLYEVTIQTVVPDVEVVIRRKAGAFDPTFLAQFRNPEPDANVRLLEQDKPTLVLSCTKDDYGGVDSVYLPPGRYEMYARKEGCGETKPQEVVVNFPKMTTMPIDFTTLTCAK